MFMGRLGASVGAVGQWAGAAVVVFVMVGVTGVLLIGERR